MKKVVKVFALVSFICFSATSLIAQCVRTGFPLTRCGFGKNETESNTPGNIHGQLAITCDNPPSTPAVVFRWVYIYAYNSQTNAEYGVDATDQGGTLIDITYDFHEADYDYIDRYWEVAYSDNTGQTQLCENTNDYFRNNMPTVNPGSIFKMGAARLLPFYRSTFLPNSGSISSLGGSKMPNGSDNAILTQY